MSGDTLVPEAASTFTTKPLLRTYSRRALSRRATSPALATRRMSGLKRLSGTDLIGDPVGDRQGIVRTPPHPTRKRRRLGGIIGGMTPTDMFLEHMSSSAPSLLRKQAAGAKEQLVRSKADGHQTATSGDECQEDEQAGTRLEDDNETGRHASSVATTAADHDAAVKESSEDSGDDEGKDASHRADEPFVETSCPASSRLEEWLDSLSSSPSYRTRIKRFRLLSATPAKSKPSSMDPFFVPSKPAPLQGFKTISQLRASQAKDARISDSFKMTKSIGDGFTDREARPNPCSTKARRSKLTSVSHLDRLELTQKEPLPQKMEGPTWLRGQKKRRPVTNLGMQSKRRDFRSSHIRIECQDPVETFDTDEPGSEPSNTSSRPKRRISEIVSDDTDEPVDLLVAHDEEEKDDGTGPFRDDEVVLLVCQDNNRDDADVDEEIDLVSFPLTLASASRNGVASSKQQDDF